MEDRLLRLEQIEQIRCLKTRYCLLCDTGYDADALAALFTATGSWDGGNLGHFEGRDSVHRFFSNMPNAMSFAVHHITNSAVELSEDGRSAKGVWYLLQAATLAAGEQAVWLSGLYEDDLVLDTDGWKFERIKITTRFFTPYDKGWAKVPILGSDQGSNHGEG